MQAPDGSRYLAGIRRAEKALEASIMNPDEDVAWSALLDGLAWLYRSEERERQHLGAKYHASRAASAEGQVLGALVYFRGEVEHSAQSNPYTVGLVDAEMWMKTSGEWRSTGQIVRISARVYPPLHAGARLDRHRRDEVYRSQVEGKALGIPLAKARAFLETC
ncbi:hypothetical protein [Cryobacterium sp. BB307]|uniref:hypothetical protein n=1 Tax=Cryobacterium sp. BB307 TaxID=2716317 RepID=UPI001447265A|nr:hypothetical protein [Cryobacterium sp. BB307]